jgi:hypothetical protein
MVTKINDFVVRIAIVNGTDATSAKGFVSFGDKVRRQVC